MSLEKDLTDMDRAALVLDLVGTPRWAAMLRGIATAAKDNAHAPTCSDADCSALFMERMRWTPLVTQAAALSRDIITAAMTDADLMRNPNPLVPDPVTPTDLDAYRDDIST